MDYSDLQITVYVANLKKRTDRLAHIKKEFDGKDEFDVRYIEAYEENVGALGLWKTLQYCIQDAKTNDEDVIVFCEDDHKFTDNYDKDFLIKNIFEANRYKAELLIGGSVGGFNVTVPVTPNLIWVNHYNSNNFLIIFSRFFDAILSKSDFEPVIKVDNTLARLAVAKFILYPYISIQKNFEYSDVTSYNNLYPEEVTIRFEKAEESIEMVSNVFTHYQQFQ